MGNPVPPNLDARRTTLAPLLATLDLVPFPQERGELLAYYGRAVRCLEQVGDRLDEVVWVHPDGRLAYRSAWAPPLAPSGPPGTADGPEWADPPADWPQVPSGEFRVDVQPAGDPAGRYSTVTVFAHLSESAGFEDALGGARAIASRYNGPTGRGWDQPLAEAPYYLLAPGSLASFQEWVEDQEVGWGTCEVVESRQEGETRHALVEQADSRGDRYRYPVLHTPEGVAVEVRGKHNLVVHDWIWRYPLQEREWVEETEGGMVACRMAFADGPVDVTAGRFWGCLQLATKNDNGASRHTYHPTAGLILSEFTDVEGVPGRRELSAIACRKA